jgi:hypothetical protein
LAFSPRSILLWLDEASGMSKRGTGAYPRVAYFDLKICCTNTPLSKWRNRDVETSGRSRIYWRI